MNQQKKAGLFVMKQPRLDLCRFLLLLAFELLGYLGLYLVALVQALEDVLGDVVLGIGIEHVVTCLGQDEVVLLGLVVSLEEAVDAVAHLLVVLGLLFLEAGHEAGIELLEGLLLLLEAGLGALKLLL